MNLEQPTNSVHLNREVNPSQPARVSVKGRASRVTGFYDDDCYYFSCLKKARLAAERD
jgi:hypothetical protein